MGSQRVGHNLTTKQQQHNNYLWENIYKAGVYQIRKTALLGSAANKMLTEQREFPHLILLSNTNEGKDIGFYKGEGKE